MSDDETGSVTHWIAALKTGDTGAAQPLWDRFFERLVRLARARFPLHSKAGVVEDEEDAALSAFRSVCEGLVDGKQAGLADRDGLWRSLVVVARRKASNKLRNARRKKRGGGRVIREAELDLPGDGQDDSGLDRLVAPGGSPELLAMMAEECQQLMGLLAHPDLRLQEVAGWRLDGLTQNEIAERLGCSRRTVNSRLELIRDIWDQAR